MSRDLVALAHHDHIAIVTLNRPKAMNALSRALRTQLRAVLQACDGDPHVQAIVLTGAGDRAFCAGLDRNDLPEEMRDVQKGVPTTTEVDPASAVANVRIPVIAAVNGIAMTGGLELLLACDFAIASRTARFADTHARLGLLPMWGLSQRLPARIGTARAKQLSLTGEFIDAEQALAWGLVNEVVAPEDLFGRALAIAGYVASADRSVVAAAKRLIDHGQSAAVTGGLVLEQREARAHLQAKGSMEALSA